MIQAGRSNTPSLSSRLLRHVTLALALTWALGVGIAVLVGDEFTGQAFDNVLLDDAYAVASNVRRQADGLELSLSEDAIDAVLYNQSEKLYYAVLRDDGSVLAGDASLTGAAPPHGSTPYAFSTIALERRQLRAVRLVSRDADAFTVIIARTTSTRNPLLLRLVTYALAPAILMLIGVGWTMRRGIRRDLAPLAALQDALAQRDANDLAPIPPELIRDARSREVERLGLAVDALLARIHDGVRAQREFAGNVAHELRTPLAGIRALAEYGLAQTDPAVQREQLKGIHAAQERASHLVDQLLALALADEARGVTLVPVALDELARDVVLRYMPRADQAGVDLGAHGLDLPVVLPANVALLEGLLGNLLDNALRYGTAPGRNPMITVELTREGEAARLAVIDNGPGLSAEQRGTLVQRWAQGTTGQALGEGAGLGLAIVSRYAALMQARFELGDAPDGAGLSASVVFTPRSHPPPPAA